MPKNTPLDLWGQATNARYACVVIKRASAGRFGPKILTLIPSLRRRRRAVEVPNPTKQALTDGATVDFDEPGVKKRPSCTQQPTVPNTGGARGHIWGRGGPKPVWVGTWPAGRRGAASTGCESGGGVAVKKRAAG